MGKAQQLRLQRIDELEEIADGLRKEGLKKLFVEVVRIARWVENAEDRIDSIEDRIGALEKAQPIGTFGMGK